MEVKEYYKYIFGEDAPKSFKKMSSEDLFVFAKSYHKFMIRKIKKEKSEK